jgi:hypothetical protein
MFITDNIWKLLEPASQTGDEATREEIEDGLQSGFFRLFTNDKSAAVVADHRGVLRIGLAGGELESLKKIEKKIVKYAKKKNYKSIDILGRVGWEKALTGYKKKAILLRKEIK